MKSFLTVALLLAALCTAEPQRRNRNGRQNQSGYGAPNAPAAPAPISNPQPQYGNSQPSFAASSLSTSSSSSGHDHQGLDWLLESVPGTPGTDYPIYGQEQLDTFNFECQGLIEGGYYADPSAQCQAFHVCVPDGLGSLSTQSFLCPNGTIFNQEYFICDWWFNFDCSQAQGLYSRNEEVQAEREQASLGQSSNNNFNTAPAPGSYQNPQQQQQQQRPASNNYNAGQSAQSTYTG